MLYIPGKVTHRRFRSVRFSLSRTCGPDFDHDRSRLQTAPTREGAAAKCACVGYRILIYSLRHERTRDVRRGRVGTLQWVAVVLRSLAPARLAVVPPGHAALRASKRHEAICRTQQRRLQPRHISVASPLRFGSVGLRSVRLGVDEIGQGERMWKKGKLRNEPNLCGSVQRSAVSYQL